MVREFKRGFVPSDLIEFNSKQLLALQRAQRDIFYLLNNEYDLNKSVTFVSNKFSFSARQRMALIRSTASNDALMLRFSKEQKLSDLKGKTVLIDGFNLIITLEIMLLNSTLLFCMDGTIRDLAGLHGTYKPIFQTDEAIKLVGAYLEKLQVKEAVFYLDSPVSNSGILSSKIRELLSGFDFKTETVVVQNPDASLFARHNVVSSDSIVLDRCLSWVNLPYYIIQNNFSHLNLIDLSAIK